MRTSNSPNLFQDTIIVLLRTTFAGTVFLSAVLLSPALATAATIFESGTLGETGIPRFAVPGANVSDTVFDGVRFELTQPVLTSQIGGHFVGSPNTTGTFFGAIVELDDENDFPDSGDLQTPDVRGSAVFSFPEPSAEVFADLSVFLEPGWYALVFGSGLFETSGDGAMPLNNPDIGEPSYIAFVSSRWRNLDGTSIPFDNYRFIVKGTIIPEPESFGLAMIGICNFLFGQSRHKNSYITVA